jgi:hypothetical protein
MKASPNHQGKRGGKGALTEAEQLQVCTWIAELKPYSEAQALVEQRFGKHLDYESVRYYWRSDRWRKLIVWMRQRILRNLTSIPIANKAVRLRHLEGIYHEAMTERIIGFNRWREPIYGRDLAGALAALAAARREMEGETPVKVESQTHLTLLSMMKKGAEDSRSVIQRVAAEEQQERSRLA